MPDKPKSIVEQYDDQYEYQEEYVKDGELERIWEDQDPNNRLRETEYKYLIRDADAVREGEENKT
jgi:hypothetical protein